MSYPPGGAPDTQSGGAGGDTHSCLIVHSIAVWKVGGGRVGARCNHISRAPPPLAELARTRYRLCRGGVGTTNNSFLECGRNAERASFVFVDVTADKAANAVNANRGKSIHHDRIVYGA